jgi:hypothetical protein
MLLEKETLDNDDLTKLFAKVIPASEDVMATAVPCGNASKESAARSNQS